uniref:Uncharacterized protein n=1 Tax=Anguilla anguilla TaxID=7936 RepID=A0A0E9RTZ8_ANGAN
MLSVKSTPTEYKSHTYILRLS